MRVAALEVAVLRIVGGHGSLGINGHELDFELIEAADRLFLCRLRVKRAAEVEIFFVELALEGVGGAGLALGIRAFNGDKAADAIHAAVAGAEDDVFGEPSGDAHRFVIGHRATGSLVVAAGVGAAHVLDIDHAFAAAGSWRSVPGAEVFRIALGGAIHGDTSGLAVGRRCGRGGESCEGSSGEQSEGRKRGFHRDSPVGLFGLGRGECESTRFAGQIARGKDEPVAGSL